MAKGRFNIKGTKDFIVAAVFCGCLCIWSVGDAWFPTKKVLKKHPQEYPIVFKIPGVVKEIHVQPGDEIGGKVLLASLHDDQYREKVAAAEADFAAAKAAKDPAVEEKLDVLMKAKEENGLCKVYNTDFSTKTSHGDDVLYGEVVKILVEPATHVDAGVPVLIVRPTDTFYLFNKTLAIISLFATGVFLIFHRIASR